MHNPVNAPSTRMMAPTSGALDPLRARQMISEALPLLRAMAAPEALVNACARWAMTASSSEDPHALDLLPVCKPCVAMVNAVLKLRVLGRWNARADLNSNLTSIVISRLRQLIAPLFD